MGIVIILGAWLAIAAAVIGAIPPARQYAANRLGELARRPVTAAGLTGLTLVVGLLGSVYASDIKGGLETWMPIVKDHPVAVFSSLFALVVLIWVSRQALLDKDRARLDADMQEGVTAIRETVTHLPPLDFLVKFRDNYQRVVDLVQSPDDLPAESVIRAVLSQMVALAEEWDRPERSYERVPVTYRASIMLYRPAEDVGEDEPAILESRRFLSKALPLDYVDGYLVLHPELSIVSNGQGDADKDPAIDVLALAVTLPDSDRAELNIPGAPLAFASGQPQWLASTQTLVEECDGWDFSERDRAAIRAYYRDNAHLVSSILSLPLTSAGERLGVVNVYRNHPHMMRSQRRADEFCALLAPFCIQLGLLLLSGLSRPGTDPIMKPEEKGR